VSSPRQLLQAGLDFITKGMTAEASDCFRQAVSIDPGLAQAHYQLGVIFSREARFEDAIAAQRRALTLQPDIAEAHTNLGYSYYSQGRLDAALSAYRKAVLIRPAYARTHYNMGLAYQAKGEFDAALRSFKRALSFEPGLAETHLSIANVYNLSLSKPELALSSYRHTLRIKPRFAHAHFALGDALLKLGWPEEAAVSYESALNADPALYEAYSNLLLSLQYRADSSPEDVKAVLSRFAAQYEAPLKKAWPRHRNSRDPRRRLKIGYVSSDFYHHSVSYFFAPVIANHDRAVVETYCYYNNDRHDAFTDLIKRSADHWMPCKGLSDSQLAERVREDGIDILVDLTGHTGSNRLLAFARKPAPVQVSWIGYPGSTGLEAMDYVITDPYLDPVGLTDRYYTETLFRLPNGFIFQPAAESPPVNELPALTSGAFTFACLNNLAKVSDEAILLWSRILAAVPRSRLLVGNGPDRVIHQRFAEALSRHGVELERLIPLPRLPLPDFLRAHHQIDLALDTFPYNGGTTSCHSLWMGVPVVTLAGPTTPSRQGAAMLGWAGLTGYTTTSREEYYRRAVELAGRLGELAQVRRSLRERIAAGNDPLVFMRRLEGAYRSMWEKWCSIATGDG
jgi:predicted O-linked N-acetylglucosamine transferase (SPINDLY family)